MRKASNIGGKFGQIGVASTLLVYCMKAKSIKFKLLSGFLYIYWIDHLYTLGSYLGILLRMPSKFKLIQRCIQKSWLTFYHILTNQ